MRLVSFNIDLTHFNSFVILEYPQSYKKLQVVLYVYMLMYTGTLIQICSLNGLLGLLLKIIILVLSVFKNIFLKIWLQFLLLVPVFFFIQGLIIIKITYYDISFYLFADLTEAMKIFCIAILLKTPEGKGRLLVSKNDVQSFGYFQRST